MEISYLSLFTLSSTPTLNEDYDTRLTRATALFCSEIVLVIVQY